MSSLSCTFKKVESNGNIPDQVVTENISKMEVDVGDVVKKALASLALAITNSALTITVAVTKLTGILILPSFVLGKLTKPLHEANVALAKHAFTPFRSWTEALSKENQRIIETDKVIEIRNKKLMFYPEAYKKQALDSLKPIMAPISFTFSIANAALWLAVKPLWIAFFAPGFIADMIIFAPIALNKEIGRLTYSPLKKISDEMFEFHNKYMKETSNFMSNVQGF